MSQQILKSIGLFFGMVGVLIIFRFGPPQPNLESGVGLDIEDGTPLADGRTVADYNRDTEKLRALYSCMSKIGLGLIFFGFAFQLWGTWG